MTTCKVLPFPQPAPDPSPINCHIADLSEDLVDAYIQVMAVEHRHDELYAFLSCLRTFRPLNQPEKFEFMVRLPQKENAPRRKKTIKEV